MFGIGNKKMSESVSPGFTVQQERQLLNLILKTYHEKCLKPKYVPSAVGPQRKELTLTGLEIHCGRENI